MNLSRITLILAAAFLSACASTNTTQVSGAAVTPLNDLNLVKNDIPEILHTAQKAPYAYPEARSCTDLALSVQELDEALGPDLDAPPSESKQNLLERSLTGAVRNAAEGVIPYRGWVRKLSGADRHAKQAAAAIAAGTVRRAFLKGISKAESC